MNANEAHDRMMGALAETKVLLYEAIALPKDDPRREELRQLMLSILSSVTDNDELIDAMYDQDVDDDREDFCLMCQGDGEVPTADYESYFGAMMKPCPSCHGKLDGLGHGRLS